MANSLTQYTGGSVELWIKSNDKAFRFPVLPPSLFVNSSVSLATGNILNSGELTLFGGTGLNTLQFSGFFPSQKYSFCQYQGFPTPYECVKLIEEMKNKGKPVRLILTDTSINFSMLIESFEYGEKAGSRDVEYSIGLKEYKPIVIPEVPPPTTGGTGSGNGSSTGNGSRPNPPDTGGQKTHTVKKGDCLWDIAHKYYGKGSRYPEIKKANQSKYPSLKKNNIIYVNWKLVIP